MYIGNPPLLQGSQKLEHSPNMTFFCLGVNASIARFLRGDIQGEVRPVQTPLGHDSILHNARMTASSFFDADAPYFTHRIA
jgi:hypothetical protein